MPATCRPSREEQGSCFQDMTVRAGVHLVARGVTDSREHPMFLGAQCRRALLPSVTLQAGVRGLLCTRRKARQQPSWPGWTKSLTHLGLWPLPRLPLQLAPETLSEQKASAPLPSAQVRHAVQPCCNPCRARGHPQARRLSPRSRES